MGFVKTWENSFLHQEKSEFLFLSLKNQERFHLAKYSNESIEIIKILRKKFTQVLILEL